MPGPTVLIGSYLEPGLVERLRADVPQAEFLYRPELLPVPAFPSDHLGAVREHDDGALAEWAGLLARAEVMFDFDWWRPADWRQTTPRLRWIQGTSAGLGARAAANGHTDGTVVLTTAAGVHAKPLAEFAVAGLLHFVRGIPGLERARAERRWGSGSSDTLRGKRALVVGAGSIGHEVAQALAFFGVRCAGATRSGRALGSPFEETVALGRLHEALGRAEIVVLACPLTDETRGLLGAAELAAMRPGALLVNVARGPVVDQPALVRALESGRLGGAVLDVAEPEPLPAGEALWNAPNTLISPHNAANVWTENPLLVDLFADNLRRWMAGEPLRNVYDPRRGY